MLKYVNFTFLSLIILFLTACSSVQEVQEAKAPALSQYMNRADIKAEFIKYSNAKEMEDHLTNEAKERLKNLIPNDKFVTHPDQIKELHDWIKSNNEGERSERLDLPSSVDRRSCSVPVVSQCGGICTAHGTANAIDNFVCKPTLQNTSQQDVWNKYKTYDTWTAVNTMSKTKVCEEKDYPNCGSRKSSCADNRHIGIKSWKYLKADVEASRAALAAGHTLVYAGKVTKSWANCDKVMNPKSATTGGGHAVAIVGYQDEPDILGGGYFIVQNSWGTDCGDKGFQYLPYYYMQRTDGRMYGYTHEIKEVYSKYLADGPGTPDAPPVEPVDPVDPVKPEPDCYRVRDCSYAFGIPYYCGPWYTKCE